MEKAVPLLKNATPVANVIPFEKSLSPTKPYSEPSHLPFPENAELGISAELGAFAMASFKDDLQSSCNSNPILVFLVGLRPKNSIFEETILRFEKNRDCPSDCESDESSELKREEA